MRRARGIELSIFGVAKVEGIVPALTRKSGISRWLPEAAANAVLPRRLRHHAARGLGARSSCRLRGRPGRCRAAVNVRDAGLRDVAHDGRVHGGLLLSSCGQLGLGGHHEIQRGALTKCS